MDDDTTARFELLKLEFSELQQSIRSFDSSRFQIKGWAVSLALASAGAALTLKLPFLNLLGAGAVLLMLLVEAHQRSFQMAFIARARRLEAALAATSVAEVVQSKSPNLGIPGLASTTRGFDGRADRLRRIAVLALPPGTFALYAGLAVGLLALTVAAG